MQKKQQQKKENKKKKTLMAYANSEALIGCGEDVRVSYVTGVSNWYCLPVGQGLLSL